MTEPTEKTIRQLFALSGNNCAFPECPLPIVERTGTITGEICHIKARHNGGPRFDHTQSDEDRHARGNLILLCRHHHKIIDSEPVIYTVEVLTDMKSRHENAIRRPESDQDGFFAKILLNDLRRISVTNNSGNVAINSPGAMQAHTINVKTSPLVPSLREQPEIHFNYTPGPQSNHGVDASQLECKWGGYLDLYNRTPYDSFDLRILEAGNLQLPPIAGAVPPHLKALDKARIKLETKRTVSKTDVPAGKLAYEVFFPENLNHFGLLAQYKNRHGKRFYTLLVKSDSKQECTFHRRRPPMPTGYVGR